jgi:hypothetical protein
MIRSLFIITLAALFAGVTAFALAQDEPSATPYRPTVSTPANLSAPGWLELEFGGQRTSGGNLDRRDSIPYSLKYAFSKDWGVRVGADAWVREVTGGAARSGFGDTAIILKRRFALSGDHVLGAEGGANFPTAKDGLGAGKTDYLVTAIYSADLGAYHTDVNLSVTRTGQFEDNESRWQKAWAASLSRALGERWGIAGELSGTNQKGATATAQFLAAASYNYSKRVVFDAGAATGLSHASPDWSAFVGVTVLLAKIR